MISVMMQAQQAEQEEKAGKTKEERARAMENLDLKKKIEIAEKEKEKKEEKIKKEKSSVAALQHLKDRTIALSLKLDGLKKAEDPDQSDTALQKLIENMIKEIWGYLFTQKGNLRHFQYLNKHFALLLL